MEIMFNNPDEIDFLFKHLKPTDNVLEWGSGGSTIEIAKRVKQLTSIEHDRNWFEKITEEIKKEGIKNIHYCIMPRDHEEAPGDDGTFEDYKKYILFPTGYLQFLNQNYDEQYDVIFIDGRARVECAKVAVTLLKPDGVILIHDIFHPTEKYRRREYEVVQQFLRHIDGEFALHSFKPKAGAIEAIIKTEGSHEIKSRIEAKQFKEVEWLMVPDSPHKTFKPKRSDYMDNTDYKKMCWYQQECVESMNRFYDKEIKGQDITEHLKGFTNLLKLVEPKDTPLLDLGTGTAMISEFTKEFQFAGSDLPHILSGCAMRNFPHYMYRAADITQDDLTWIESFPVVVVNGVIDIMKDATEVLRRVLEHTSKYLLIHRQEITEQGRTTETVMPSYNSNTYHSIINRNDFNTLVDEMNFDIVKEEQLCFTNWENKGSSFLLKRRKSYSLHKIDHKLYTKYFKGKANGVFLEAGANDGERQSNTLYLEEYKNWSGILIEPIRDIWKECQAKRSRLNICVNAALVADGYVNEWGVPFITMSHIPGTHGLMSVVNDGNEQKQIDKIRQQEVIQMDVPARSLNSILDNIWNEDLVIDLAVIDVEGYEKEVLKGIDLDKWQIEYLLIEQRDETTDVIEIIGLYYQFIEQITEHDYLYKRRPIKLLVD